MNNELLLLIDMDVKEFSQKNKINWMLDLKDNKLIIGRDNTELRCVNGENLVDNVFKDTKGIYNYFNELLCNYDTMLGTNKIVSVSEKDEEITLVISCDKLIESNFLEGKIINITKSMKEYMSKLDLEKRKSVLNNRLDSIYDSDGIYIKDSMCTNIEKSIKAHKRGALLIVDLDDFKFINDSFGHKYGDMFLTTVENNIRNIIGKGNLICRYNGDEFLILLVEVIDSEAIELLTKNIIESFDKAYNVAGCSIYSTASIGVAVFPDHGTSMDELIRNADSAMYVAKSNGKCQYQLFNYNITQELNKIYTIQKELGSALEKKEFHVVFQPKVKLANGKVTGFESLIRWKSEKLGMVSPVEFIPIAETTRMIIPIGEFVLEEVCSKVKYLCDNGYREFKIAVNISEVQLRDGTLVDTFRNLLNKYEIDASYIEIEITESLLMKSVDKSIKVLLEIKNLGITIALDDFGTGYSSLNYLTRLPIDVLKIDRSFVIDMVKNTKSKCIVENIIQLSHQLGIEVVAEGVELKEQINYLKRMLCDIVQGYYYSKPQPFETVLKMM